VSDSNGESYYLTISRKDGSEERVPVTPEWRAGQSRWSVVGAPFTLTPGDVMWVPPFLADEATP
jgi:hypothetical protein